MSTKRKKMAATGRLGLIIFLLMIFSHPIILNATIYGKISGRVTIEGTDQGLKNVTVLLFMNSYKRPVTETKTDQNGNYSFEILQEGRYALLFGAGWDSDYYVDQRIDYKEDLLRNRSFAIEKGQHVRINRVAIRRGEFRAIIKKKDGTKFPITEEMEDEKHFGLAVVLFDEQKEDYLLMFDPLKSGELFAKVRPGLYSVKIEMFGHPTRRIEGIRIEKGGITINEFIIDQNDPTGIEGKVIYSDDGSPNPETLMATYDDKTNEELCTMYTDENGYYSVVGLSPGIYRIWCSADGKSYKNIVVEQGKRTRFDISVPRGQQISDAYNPQGIMGESYPWDYAPGKICGPFSNDFFFGNNTLLDQETNPDEWMIYYKWPKYFFGLFLGGSEVPLPKEEWPNYSEFFTAFRGAIEKGRNGNCLPEKRHKDFSKNLNRFPYRFGLYLFPKKDIGPCGEIPYQDTLRSIFDSKQYNHINLYVMPWPEERCGCPESVIFHELLHLLTTGQSECSTYACTKDCYPCAIDQPEYADEEKKGTVHEQRCWEKDANGQYKWRIDCSGKKVPDQPVPPSARDRSRPDHDHSTTIIPLRTRLLLRDGLKV